MGEDRGLRRLHLVIRHERGLPVHRQRRAQEPSLQILRCGGAPGVRGHRPLHAVPRPSPRAAHAERRGHFKQDGGASALKNRRGVPSETSRGGGDQAEARREDLHDGV